MAVLSVHLQEGFNDDLVVIRINGAEAARRGKVKTKMLLGYAEIIELAKPSDHEIRLELSLPDRQMAESTTVPRAGDSFVAANVTEGRLRLTVRDRPFAYM